MGPWPREREGNAGGARGCKSVRSRTRRRQCEGGTGRTSSGGLGGVPKSSLHCSTWEVWGEKGRKRLGCCQTPGVTGNLTLFRGFSPVSPPKFPHTVPSPVRSYPQIPWQARTLGLRQPEAPAKQIPAPRCRLCPQPHTPVHPPAPPTLPSRSLGHGPIHTAVATPTSVAVTTPLPLPPQLLSPEHYRATHPARGAAATHRRRFQGRGNTSRRHAEGFGRCPVLPRGAEGVCSPLLGSKGPLQLCSIIIILLYSYSTS